MGLDLAGIGVHSTYSLRSPKPGPAGPNSGLPELRVLPGAREEPEERLRKCLGVRERGGVPGAGNLLIRAFGTWSTTCCALMGKIGLDSDPRSTITGTEIAPSGAAGSPGAGTAPPAG